MADSFETLSLTRAEGIATVGFDSPPINVFDLAMQADLEAAFDAIEADPSVRVVVFESRHPEYFIAHYDVISILAEDASETRTSSGSFNRLMERIARTPKVTIAKIAGAARGGGCELLLALDMRFAARGRAVFGFPESALGIVAAGGGTQRLPLAIGRGRALEMLLGAADFDAELAERYGLVNRALPEAELDSFVADLARRIVACPPRSAELAKMAVGSASPHPNERGLALEALALDLLKAQPQSREAIARFLEAGGQKPEGERDFATLLEALRAAPGGG